MPLGTAFARRDGPINALLRKPILSCYFPLGDPRIGVDLLDIYVGEGVDVIEIGMASPDPFLDGDDVRASMQRADRALWRADLDAVLSRLSMFRDQPRALLMTYAYAAHPGLTAPGFWRDIDSLLIVARSGDPLAAHLEQSASDAGVALSAFLPLPLTDDHVARARNAGFYIMLQANDGPTGPRNDLDKTNATRIETLRKANVSAPILLGFGISSGEQAQAARNLGADGVVVGSKVLRASLSTRGELQTLLHDLRSGLDA